MRRFDAGLNRLGNCARKERLDVFLNFAIYSALALAGSRSTARSITDCGTDEFIIRVGA
jgi:hypothetical protein